ncbi:MAG: aminotransferase class V-fold PLP-dependent enzyme [Actinomycetota bacterium]|nr:aminotransferase class V-fold PLP-dependent enzyme [Actinomycetota bacterium]
MSDRQPKQRAVHYFDHAATSWPRPPEVVEAVARGLTEYGGSPGRGAYELAMRSARALFDARQTFARFLGAPHAEDVIIVPSCTWACNLMLQGLLRPGDRVVVGSMEHNAVVRPLSALAALGVEVVVVDAETTGFVDPDDVERAVKAAPTRAVVCQHASNVTGTIQYVGDLADIAHEHDAVMLVDGAQAVGHIPVDVRALGVDAYAVPGHKALLGPPGIGLLWLSERAQPDPLVLGGTGSGSSETEAMPTRRPERFEAGTANVPAALGLAAGMEVRAADPDASARESELAMRVLEGLSAIPGVRVLGPGSEVPRVPVVSFVHERVEADRLAFELDRRWGIACRAGLHCAPWAHRTLGSFEGGAVRISVGWSTTGADVDALLTAFRNVLA